MENTANVIEFSRDNNISEYVDMFIHNDNTNHTAKDYMGDLKQFFNGVFNTEDTNLITINMLRDTDSKLYKKYFQRLIRKGELADTTIKRKIATVRSFFKYLNNEKQNGIIILNYNPMANLKFKIKAENKKSYGLLTDDEVKSIIKLVQEDGDKELELFYSLLYKTGVRSNAIKSLNIKSFYKYNGICRIRGIDKDNKPFDKEIGNVLYEKAKKLADENGVIFHFGINYPLNKLCGKDTFNKDGSIKTKYSNTYCSRIGISQEDAGINGRYITIHSLKKASVTTVMNNGGTIRDMAEQGSHSNYQYLSTYTNDNNLSFSTRFINLDDLITTNEKLENKLCDMSKEDIISMITSLSNNNKMEILNKLNEL